jgi:hypothetical protein
MMTDVEIAPKTRLGTALVPDTSTTLNNNNVTSFRPVASQARMAQNLGPLQDLPGHWQGTGFNLIARPDFDTENEDGFFLELNLLRETIEFTSIGSPIQNRGSRQDDVALFGVTYMQRVTDATTGGALHIEPGLFLRIPSTSTPESVETVARLGNVPHGNSYCAVGEAHEMVPDASFRIPPTPTVPFEIGGQQPPVGAKNPFQAYDLSVESKFRTHPLPPEITQEIVNNPAMFNQHMLDGHTIAHMTVLPTTTESAGGVDNIPFITHNANAVHFDSVFAIQRIVGPLDTELLQLQYTQTALLNFRGMTFPHVTVATMVKAF